MATLLLCGALPARAQDALPASVQASLFLKVLSYDRALDRNGGGDLVVAVIYDAASPASTAAKTEFVRAVRASGTAAVGGRALRLVEVNVAAGQLASALKARSAAAAYVTTGLEARLTGIADAARVARVTTFGGSEAYARRGLAVAVDALGGKPQLFVNLAATRSCGADLPTSVLKLATVIS